MTSNRENMISRALARKSLIAFTEFTFKDYDAQWFHKAVCKQYDRFANDEVKKMMVFMPPQHGKSELNTRRLPALLIGKNPDMKIAIAAYSATLAASFNRNIRQIMSSDGYRALFPLVSLPERKDQYELNTTHEFSIPGRNGSIITVGVGGSLTGRPVDVAIIDDPIKNMQQAQSEAERKKIIDWYNSVILTRLGDAGKILITLTRWHQDDLAGYLMKEQHDDWTIFSLPAIATENPSEIDIREPGDALWPERHSAHSLLEKKRLNAHIFESLYQQNPKPAEGLVLSISELRRYNGSQLDPKSISGKFVTVDMADEGKDSTCAVLAYLIDGEVYIQDVIFTRQPVEVTNQLIVNLLKREKKVVCSVESNAGGKLFAQMIQGKVSDRPGIVVDWFKTTTNKHTRILVNAPIIKHKFLFRSDYQHGSDYEKYMNELTSYTLDGQTKHDDAIDATVMLVQKITYRPLKFHKY